MKFLRFCIAISTVSLLCACAPEEPPPRSVKEFVESPILLEAAMVRCAQDRSRTKYDPECVNARDAANRLAVAEEEKRREDLESQFERKRKQLRRTQDAAQEARRRVAEEQRRRAEAEYLGVFEELPPAEDVGAGDGSYGNAPSQTPTPGLEGNQPGVILPTLEDAVPDGTEKGGTQDIDSIREELKRRQSTTG